MSAGKLSVEYPTDFQEEIRIMQKDVIGLVGKNQKQTFCDSQQKGQEHNDVKDAGRACSVKMNQIQNHQKRTEA